MPGSEFSRLREPLAAIAREAGALALAAADKPLRQWMKAGASPVSEADIAVNDLLLKRLRALAPQAGWLSEETEDDRARTNAAQVWVVDPIDGTRAFLQKRPDWTVSIALVETGRPAVAALYAPVTDELFLACRDEGATRNAVRLSVSPGTALAAARIAGPKGYLERLGALEPRIAPQPKIFSLALRLARVASGEFEASFASRNSHDWDLAAADLLLQEAGGVLTDLSGAVVTYNRPEPVHSPLVAAGAARHPALIDLVRDRRAEFA